MTATSAGSALRLYRLTLRSSAPGGDRHLDLLQRSVGALPVAILGCP